MNLSLCCNFDDSMTEQITSYRAFMRRSRGRLMSGSDGPSYMTVRRGTNVGCVFPRTTADARVYPLFF
jgi:hypothetical protein